MLKERIKRAIEEKRMKHGIMGNETASVTLSLNETERTEVEFLNFDEHYHVELDENKLTVSYTEEINY